MSIGYTLNITLTFTCANFMTVLLDLSHLSELKESYIAFHIFVLYPEEFVLNEWFLCD